MVDNIARRARGIQEVQLHRPGDPITAVRDEVIRRLRTADKDVPGGQIGIRAAGIAPRDGFLLTERRLEPVTIKDMKKRIRNDATVFVLSLQGNINQGEPDGEMPHVLLRIKDEDIVFSSRIKSERSEIPGQSFDYVETWTTSNGQKDQVLYAVAGSPTFERIRVKIIPPLKKN